MTRGGRAKFKRGGGRNFSRHLELNENGTAVAIDHRRTKGEDEEDEEDEEEEDEDEEEEGSEDEESEEGVGLAPSAVLPEQEGLSRADRKALKKQGKKKAKVEGEDEEDEDEDPLLANPNRTVGRMKISDLAAASGETSKKERVAKEKAEAKERSLKLHVQGKTEQGQKDLERLRKIRAERDEAKKKRKAEADAKAAEIEAKKAAGRR